MDSIVHFEITADNLERAQKFYTSVFGWNISKYPGMEYHAVRTVEVDDKHLPVKPGAINGGMIKKCDKTPSPVLVINVASVKEKIKQLEKAGGKIVVPPTKVGDVGIIAYFKDTEENVLGLWEELKHTLKHT